MAPSCLMPLSLARRTFARVSGGISNKMGAAAAGDGAARVDPLFQTGEPSPSRAEMVTFSPGGRSGWQSHPLGRTIIISAGNGLIQRRGGCVEAVSTGDVPWFPPGEEYWHGAPRDAGATHITLTTTPEDEVAGAD